MLEAAVKEQAAAAASAAAAAADGDGEGGDPAPAGQGARLELLKLLHVSMAWAVDMGDASTAIL